MNTFRRTVRPFPSVVAGLAAAVTSLPLWLGVVPTAHADDKVDPVALLKGVLDIIGQVSQGANAGAKAIEILSLVNTAQDPCPCIKALLNGSFKGIRAPGGYDPGLVVEELRKECVPLLELAPVAIKLQEVAEKGLKNIGGSLTTQRALKQLIIAVNQECAKSSMFFTPIVPGGEEALVAGLAPYVLPGSRPLAAGDLDGNGSADLAVCDADADTVTLLMATPFGDYEVVDTLFAGIGPSFVFIDDVDRDGRNDVVVLNAESRDGALFLGNGDGTVRSPILFDPVRGGQVTVDVDLDGDGGAERVSIAAPGDRVTVEGIAPAGFYDIFFDSPAEAVLPTDLDGDGFVDLSAFLGDTRQVAVAYGNGDGTFGEPLAFPFTPAPVSEPRTEPNELGVKPLPFFDVGERMLDTSRFVETPLVISPLFGHGVGANIVGPVRKTSIGPTPIFGR